MAVGGDWLSAHATAPNFVRNKIEDYQIRFFCRSCVYTRKRIDIRAYNSIASRDGYGQMSPEWVGEVWWKASKGKGLR